MNETLLIGCGNLGISITDAFICKKQKISIIEKDKKIIRLLKKKKNNLIKIYENFKEIDFDKCKYLMLCVKPIDLKKLIEKLKHFIQKNNIIVSFVAGVMISTLKKFFNSNLSVVRIMPNLSIKYGESVTAIYSNDFAIKEKNNFKKKFSFFGSLVWLNKEEQINFFTAFFGGGPAYICFFMLCLQKILEKKINTKTSKILMHELLNGTVNFLNKENIGFDELIKKVASKGGTTENALKNFSKGKEFESIITLAINEAVTKSKKLSKSHT